MTELEEKVKELYKMIKSENYDQKRLVELATEFGVELPRNKKCGDCWKDFCFVLRSTLRTELMKQSDRKYILKDGVDVIFNGERINNGMLTDKKAKQLINQGFATYLFAKLPEK